ncbi:MAG: hypothetical protein AAB116_05045 [Candidatus Poribacteria bacterium]
MATLITEEVLKDPYVASVAISLSVANKKAQECGVDLKESMISITQENSAEESFWRINYGPKNYINRRGGDLIIYVYQEDGRIHKVLRGQ